MPSSWAWRRCRRVPDNPMGGAGEAQGQRKGWRTRWKAAVDESGQATVEFCLVACAFLVVILGGWAIVQAFSSGQLADHAVSSAAHVLEASPTGVLADIFAV